MDLGLRVKLFAVQPTPIGSNSALKKMEQVQAVMKLEPRNNFGKHVGMVVLGVNLLQ